MLTSPDHITKQGSATGVRFSDNIFYVVLSDGREIGVPLEKVSWLDWLLKASPEQRGRWSIEPNGFAIYWDDLDDGIEICHLLDMQPLSER